MMNRRFVIAIFPLLLSASASLAGNGTPPAVQMVPVIKAVNNLADAVNHIKKYSDLPAVWPVEIPKPATSQPLYANYASGYMEPGHIKFWRINIDTNVDCRGMNGCNLGYVMATAPQQLERYYLTSALVSANNRACEQVMMKQPIKLERNYIGYYTPFHVLVRGMASMMEWQINNTLYTLQWKVPSLNKEALAQMANSAIQNMTN
jgi:hypothetical protein